MSPPMLPSLKVSAIHGSKCVITRGFTFGMLVQVVVQAVGLGVHQLLQPRRGSSAYCAFMSPGSMNSFIRRSR